MGRKQDSFDTLHEKRVAKNPERHTTRQHEPTQGEIRQPNATAAVLGHRKSVQAGMAILLCQLLLAFSVSEGEETRHVFEWTRGGGERERTGREGEGGMGGGRERENAVTNDFTSLLFLHVFLLGF